MDEWQTNTPEEEPVLVPRVVRRKRRLIIGGLAIAFLLIIVIGGGIWMWRTNIPEEPEEDTQAQLPLAIDQVPAGEPTAVEQVNIGVEIAYRSDPELAIEIRSAKQTTDRTTVEFYEPQSEEVSYSRLQLLNEAGEVMEEAKFTVPTSFIVEFGPLERAQTVPAGEGTLYLVLPVTASERPVATVRVVSQDQEDELDRLEETIPLSQFDESWRQLLGKRAQAQSAPDSVYTVLILNEAGAEGLAPVALQQAQAMGSSIRPWSTLAAQGQVQFVMAPSSAPLGCTLESIPGRPETFPVCRDQARVFQTANAVRPDWDTIIVPMNASCGTCGTAYLGSNVVAIGNQPLAYTMAHELGHSIAHLRDEYGYTIPGYPPQPGSPINCFPSQAACQQAIAPYVGQPAATCSLGCEQAGQWRPATAIMHTFGASHYGPLEEANVHATILSRIIPPAPTPPPPPAETTTGPPSPAANEPVVTQEGEHIGVLVRLTTEPDLQLVIEEVEITNGPLTADLYAPEAGDPYSLLQLVGPDGSTPIAEVPFTLPTQAIGEGAGEDLVVIPATTSTAYLVIPRPAAGVSGVRVAAPSNRGTIDERTFTAPPKLDRPVRRSSWWQQWWQSLVNPAWAAEPFDILVMNEAGAGSHLSAAVSAAQQMISIDPWSAFAGKVRVIGKNNTRDLGCEATQLGAGTYPSCPNAGRVMQVASSLHPEWDAIVVVTDVPNQAGTVFAPKITAVGSGVVALLILHEFGHAVGNMVDEYGYQFDEFPIQGGINCFDSATECREAIEPFAGEEGAECSLGCTQKNNWRPATRVMHNTYEPLLFGPLERCFMYNSIAMVVGEPQEDCAEPSDTDKVNDTEFYWGWRR